MTTMTLDPGARQSGATRGGVRLLNAPLSSATWRSYAYLWLMLLLAPLAFAYVLATVVFTVGAAVTVVGLFVAGALVTGGRWWGSVYRGLAGYLLGTEVASPAARPPRQGFWPRVGGALGDAVGWRALLFMITTLPVTLAGLIVSTACLVLGIGGVTYWTWFWSLPPELAMDGSWHTPPGFALVAAGGLGALVLWPVLQRGVVAVPQLLTRVLLGPTAVSLRLAELERSRAGTVEDADARLRRIERDLHDGTQARLVAVGMQLGEARQQLASGDTVTVGELLEVAHTSTKDALVELRELARGIHPPALDSGLAVALETLSARAPLPVTAQVDAAVEARGRLAPAIESIVYFSIAELVTNAAKHAHASRVHVLVEALFEEKDGILRIQVLDDGAGGATVVPHDGSGLRSGLAGLAERVRSVDGTFGLSSPVGGPTVVTLTLPAVPAVAEGGRHTGTGGDA
ncbi:sensor histidine kinase [Myceligenerans salitolerans]|uniref:histidine kinase n=1 Tax=Myceligenerans salitolerans TaxID=1230528 RepID=A0ABS3IAN7_9MICO|nr:sensor domain-containing protein [Myceligenerans salitolerans]MBO0610090.1 sensor domain-containing protein [Myceligenerans salitolerans]